ncbi:hypothetical protein [Nevskia ramosa]|uniref:hypothetical protein n=1 Tax=Nevskia ramosa TaxID=64002 RepID=UPI003D0E592B
MSMFSAERREISLAMMCSSRSVACRIFSFALFLIASSVWAGKIYGHEVAGQRSDGSIGQKMSSVPDVAQRNAASTDFVDEPDKEAEYAIRWFPSKGGPANATAVAKLFAIAASKDEDKLVVRYYVVKPQAGAPVGATAILRSRDKANNKKFQLMFKYRASTPFDDKSKLCPLKAGNAGEDLTDKGEWDVSWVASDRMESAYSYSCSLKSDHPIAIQPAFEARPRSPVIPMRRVRYELDGEEISVEEWSLPDGRFAIEVSRMGKRTHASLKDFVHTVSEPIVGAGALLIPESMTKLATRSSP